MIENELNSIRWIHRFGLTIQSAGPQKIRSNERALLNLDGIFIHAADISEKSNVLTMLV